MQKHYLIGRVEEPPDGSFICCYRWQLDTTRYLLRPVPHVVLHSPTGVECGYQGSGAADLAASILADWFGILASIVEAEYHLAPFYEEGEEQERARLVIALHHRFKDRFIAGLKVPPQGAALISGFEISKWLEGELQAAAKREEPEPPMPAPAEV